MRTLLGMLLFSFFMVYVTTLGGCSSGSSSSSHQYLKIPNAVFVAGKPSGARSATAQKPTITPPASTTYTVNQTVKWTVTFSTIIDITVTDIIIESVDLDGYFVYPLTDAEIAAGEVEIDTEVVDAEPDTKTVCNRDYRGNGTCYGPADAGVTTMDFTAANDSGAAADTAGTFSWTDIIEETVIIPAVDNGNSNDNNGSSGDATCSGWTAMCSCNFRACCTSSSCWYDVGTGVYNCASPTNCTSAAQDAVNWCTRGC